MSEGAGNYLVRVGDISPEEFEPLPGQEGNPDVRFLIEGLSAPTPLCLFHCVFPPGALHGRHQHPNADEFVYIVRGHAAVGTDDDELEAGPGTVVYSRRGAVHWLRNVSASEEVELIGGFAGVATLDAAGYVFVGEVTDELRRIPARD